MANIVYVHRLDGMGEEPIDLDLCRRYVIRDLDSEDRASTILIYYFHNNIWFKYETEACECFDFDEFDRERTYYKWSETYQMVYPERVAYEFLWHYHALPEELEPYRAIARDPVGFEEWKFKFEYRARAYMTHTKPKPRWDPAVRLFPPDFSARCGEVFRQ
jgi:hypothetical protein